MITLKEGDKAPLFSAKDQNEANVSLTHFKGKKVVLYFYPQDNTTTCTVQACNLRDHYKELTKKGYVVIGVSPDGVESHKKFESKYKLPFILLADPEHKILSKYGVWGEKKLFGNKYMGVHRTTFVIDEKGIIKKYFLNPRVRYRQKRYLQQWEIDLCKSSVVLSVNWWMGYVYSIGEINLCFCASLAK